MAMRLLVLGGLTMLLCTLSSSSPSSHHLLSPHNSLPSSSPLLTSTPPCFAPFPVFRQLHQLRSRSSHSPRPRRPCMSSSSFTIHDMQTVDLDRISPSDFQRLYDQPDGRPVLLKNAIAMRQEERESWCEELVGEMAGSEIEFQRRCKGSTSLEYESFEDFIDIVFDSKHDDYYFLFDESLLEDKESLRKRISLRQDFFPGNLFELFPKSIRPKDSCLVIGGVGSRSTLHADPYDWMGWNFCLEGSKLWTFLPPSFCGERVAARADLELLISLEADDKSSYRLEPNAWDAEDEQMTNFSLAAGWQSDNDLYREMFATGIVWMEQNSQQNLINLGRLEIPSIAIASQYANLAGFDRVLNHMLDWSKLPSEERPKIPRGMEEDEAARLADVVLSRIMQRQLNLSEGEAKKKIERMRK
ncbi:hypothetical protein GUITHDRAFT_162130 [Guillardia theta CCMP2712]|uniref:JmjC domain-containing protein n=1 Tax=Guillardia theta (strain CCMP2712) TaxID=905079 RepID=L1JM62_GUITC|nr:hypothetical protein GUITHDRAFT_162130 [Guillardia theta CCMP2712]EKX49289.1 hypothetical protein GUITHDRAFT_162130 [Guillardia theta CCMP2712]|eukprot:XP_005836269.1 hypothetical protein GUITHDRAFT_162130 [Guillardia theta CCMP2712]